ncbi:hypothetical protein [Streptomyces sp. NPDC046862]|uniref:hypothetical protein n=1 Tax=Streptomyces sp. NPDC046862 TaxID=3154603 RepID=UPI0034547828
MPSAPATPPGPPTGGSVINLHDWRTTPKPTATSPGAAAIGGNTAYQPDQSDDPLTDLACTLEALYAEHERTLTDPATRQAFEIAMDATALMLQGALAQGHLTPEQHLTLHGMIEGMRSAPRAL